MFTIDPRRTDLALEFKRRPFGPHSPELQAVLNVLRGSRHCQDLLLVCTRPHAEWQLAEKQPYGQPPRLIPGAVFDQPRGRRVARLPDALGSRHRPGDAGARR